MQVLEFYDASNVMFHVQNQVKKATVRVVNPLFLFLVCDFYKFLLFI